MTPLATVLAEPGISQYELVRRAGRAGQTSSCACHGRGVSLRTRDKSAMALGGPPAPSSRRWDGPGPDAVSQAGPETVPSGLTPSSGPGRAGGWTYGLAGGVTAEQVSQPE